LQLIIILINSGLQILGGNMIKSLLLTTILATFSFNASATEIKEQKNAFVQENFVANKKKYKAGSLEKDFINAWGIAIRPAGSGGHFWVTAKDVSYEYVGDVRASEDKKLQKLHTDMLKYVKLPVGGKEAFATGTVFNDSKDNFVISQEVKGAEKVTAPAKFLFASDAGIISAWTERKKEDGSFDRPSEAVAVIDESKEGSAFFGLAINSSYDKIYAANFGAKPSINVYDGNFKKADISFDNPFDDNKNRLVDAGEYAPFNIQALKTPEGEDRIFVAYAKTQECPKEEIKKKTCNKGEIFAAEEDTSKPGLGRVAEFTEEGKLVDVWKDGGKLSAPWGLAFAPQEGFGSLSGKLLVTNFGDGTIAAYDAKTKEFIDVIRGKNGKPIEIKQIWGILFGNGVSLGDKNALYFAAGPDDEADGLFGVIRPAE
jgi:uncharacterized protein (TIGR03118 family)